MAERAPATEDPQVNESDSPDHENPVEEPSLGRVERFLARRRRTAAGRFGVRIVVTLFGLTVILGGIVLLPLPGPGWVIIFGGLAIWSLEYELAARLRRFAIRGVSRWTRWFGEQSWWTRSFVGLGLLVIILAIVIISLVVSIGPNFVDDIRSWF